VKIYRLQPHGSSASQQSSSNSHHIQYLGRYRPKKLMGVPVRSSGLDLRGDNLTADAASQKKLLGSKPLTSGGHRISFVVFQRITTTLARYTGIRQLSPFIQRPFPFRYQVLVLGPAVLLCLYPLRRSFSHDKINSYFKSTTCANCRAAAQNR
jgi:hypothetical protein